jgi:hypothetical protein
MVIKPFCRRYCPSICTRAASVWGSQKALYVTIEGNADLFWLLS